MEPSQPTENLGFREGPGKDCSCIQKVTVQEVPYWCEIWSESLKLSHTPEKIRFLPLKQLPDPRTLPWAPTCCPDVHPSINLDPRTHPGKHSFGLVATLAFVQVWWIIRWYSLRVWTGQALLFWVFGLSCYQVIWYISLSGGCHICSCCRSFECTLIQKSSCLLRSLSVKKKRFLRTNIAWVFMISRNDAR